MQERPVSVTIFGILNIGLGLLGIAGLLLSKFVQEMGATARSQTANSTVAFMERLNHDPLFEKWQGFAVPLDSVASVVLVAAGIGLLLSRNWGRTVSVGYGMYKLLLTAGHVVVLWVVLQQMLAQALNQYGSTLVWAAVGAGAIGVVITLIYPVLLLFFMTRPKVVQAFRPLLPPPPQPAPPPIG